MNEGRGGESRAVMQAVNHMSRDLFTNRELQMRSGEERRGRRVNVRGAWIRIKISAVVFLCYRPCAAASAYGAGRQMEALPSTFHGRTCPDNREIHPCRFPLSLHSRKSRPLIKRVTQEYNSDLGLHP